MQLATVIDGKRISDDIKDEVRSYVQALGGGVKLPHLAVVIAGNDPASRVYVKNKKKACEYAGILSTTFELSEDCTEEALLGNIAELNSRADINGILVQLPLPKHISEEKILNAILPEKDVDCFHPNNVGKLYLGGCKLLSCTPAGIVEMIKRSGISIEGKNCVVIGRSNIVGKPVAALMLQENATVTICHSRTRDLAKITSAADILVVAIGRKKFVTADMVKEGAVVIDVGIHRLGNKKLCGDVDFGEVSKKAGYITPVPGGVGPMTIAMLMKNCVTAYEIQKEKTTGQCKSE